MSLRILHVIPSVSPLRGGPSEVVRSVAKGLAERGVEVHVATTDDDGPGRRPVALNEAVVEDGVTWRYFARGLRTWTFSLPLRQWLARSVADYDVVHIHALFNWPAMAAASSARGSGVPYIVRPLGTLDAWGIRFRRPLLKKVSFRLNERRILRGAAWIHYSTDHERRDAEAIAGPLPFRVIPNPVAAAPASTRKVETGPFSILFLSRIDPKKGLDLLLPAVARVRGAIPGIRLVIAGSGDVELTRELRTRAAALGLGQTIEWAGFLQGERKEEAFRRADLFVLPSRSENFGVAVGEAMMHGVPVLISDRVGVYREIADAGAGMIVPCDVESLAAGMLRLAADPGLRRQFAENGLRLAQSRYSQSAVAGMLEREYEQLAGARR